MDKYIGKLIRVTTKTGYTVTAVYKDLYTLAPDDPDWRDSIEFDMGDYIEAVFVDEIAEIEVISDGE